jgi:alkanesulfonate monooxygenase SsuD/methylene tetrahydromethanopterin reductase-like flavin-dependent oxidoreductase (luciferase family)
MRLGVTLPQFRSEPDAALAVARTAEDAGLDGVFVFDHLWPLGQPHRPALHSYELLGAIAAETSSISVGTLVARVGLLPDAVFLHALLTLHQIAGDRLVAGLGTGDAANRDENLAYGVGYPSMAERRTRLVDCCRALSAAGVATWVGGRSAAARRMAVAGGATGWNGWGLNVALFAAEAAELAGTGVEPTWAGQVLIGRTREEADAKRAAHGTRPGLVWGTVDDLRRHLDALADAGATWAVCAPLDIGRDPSAVATLSEAVAARP